MSKKILIETKGLKKYFPKANGNLHAVDDVNLKIYQGETLGIVGESGCGKSTLGRTILRLIDPTDGNIMYDGKDISKISNNQMRKMRKNMQLIFQDPYSSLNPRMTVSEIIMEPIIFNKIIRDKKKAFARACELMDTVGLSKRLQNSYPHELDGGRRQRIGVARALALEPDFIVCDEPVSALDVSIQAQILNLLMDLQDELNLTYMFITHDLSVVKHISNEIVVMYLGNVIERAPSDELFTNPIHPYTKGLLSAIPDIDIDSEKKREIISGEVTSPINPAPGCRFAPRCKHAKPACLGEDVTLKEVSDNHFVACKVFGEVR